MSNLNSIEQMKQDLNRKTGGFLKGVCHPKGESVRIREAGIEWVRMDAPYPFDENGYLSESHIDFVNTVKEYAEQGLRTVVISPYPDTFLEHGIDARTPEGQADVRRICAFMAKEYAPYGVCWQATNEMHIVHFRSPLTSAESVGFLVASLQGLREGDPDAAIGHNSVSHDGGWDEDCLAVNRRADYDYIGFDLYNGTWSDGGPQTYVKHIEQISKLVNKPVILMEFGLSSKGGNIHRGGREMTEYLSRLGYASDAEVFVNPTRFIEHLPPALRRSVTECAPEDFNTAILNCFPHLLKSWIAEEVFPHDEEGQAKFYETLLPMLMNTQSLAGAVLYCWRDSDTCFSCGSPGCPCETAWGITRLDGSIKPAYEAIQKIYKKNSVMK